MKTYSLLFLFILIALSNPSVASHVHGADLTYTCQGNGNYLVTYTFYRDCIGIPPPTTVNLYVDNVCGTPGINYTVQISPGNTTFPNCPLSASTCNGGSTIGIEKYTYDTLINLPDTCQYWRLGVSICCRSAWINSFVDPSNYELFVEAVINNTNNYCDTSTIFNNNPPVFTCINQLNCIDPGLFDANGDSMVAYFVNPLSGSNVNLAYDSGYSILYPMDLDSQWTINSSTGQFCFTPLTVFATVYAIRVSSYRNGELVGEVYRDVMLYTSNCIASQPEISLSNSTSTDTFVCVNYPICLDLITTDPTPGDSTLLSWDNGISSATFTVNSAQNEFGSFCWTPQNSDVGTLPHCFNAFVKDNECPANQSNFKTFCITVYDSATCATLNTSEIYSNYHFKIYPQPATNILNVELINPNKQLIFSVHDLLGKIILERNINVSENKFSLSTEKMIPGIYVGMLRNDDGTVVSQCKIVKVLN